VEAAFTDQEDSSLTDEKPPYGVAGWTKKGDRVGYVAPLVLGGNQEKHERMMAVLSTNWDHLFYRLEGVSSAWMVMLCWSGLYFGIKYYHLLASRLELTFEQSGNDCVLTMVSDPEELGAEFGYELLYAAILNTLRGLLNR